MSLFIRGMDLKPGVQGDLYEGVALNVLKADKRGVHYKIIGDVCNVHVNPANGFDLNGTYV